MSELIDESTQEGLKQMLEGLSETVKLVYFTQEYACGACREQQRLLETLAGLSDKLSLEVYDLVKDAERAHEYAIAKVPATAVVGAQDHGIRFYGVTGGYEFASLVEAVLMISQGRSGLGPELERLVALIDVPVHLEIMVTLTCPYCPKMVRLAHQLAFANPHIRADMVEASEFPQLVQRYEVRGVPRTVINEVPAFEGALPAPDALLEILKAVKPDVYETLEAQLREARGERRATAVDPQHRYDVIIVGAGPAAMSAAIYATRKNLDVAVLGDRIGGQITNTASIENWLGIPSISGRELATLFRNHTEQYPVAERLHVKVRRIERERDGFGVLGEDATRYRASAVIYCAGKEYRRLDVPGERRFLGRGIAFCATCDAPLYRDKRVAVIGGGNSAFTAARDLLGYAREIHIVNILDDFQADPVLFEQVTKADHVRLHPATRVKEFLGQEQLSGVRLEAVGGSRREDLAVEGVFLEIGLVPNSAPVEGLLELNALGEIPVQRDQSSAVPGLFAAGDVTDETEKQIIVAAGAGAKAALAAHRHLSENGWVAETARSDAGMD
jgi:alkyl hydroperoxide reductase subunit F